MATVHHLMPEATHSHTKTHKDILPNHPADGIRSERDRTPPASHSNLGRIYFPPSSLNISCVATKVYILDCFTNVCIFILLELNGGSFTSECLHLAENEVCAQETIDIYI